MGFWTTKSLKNQIFHWLNIQILYHYLMNHLPVQIYIWWTWKSVTGFIGNRNLQICLAWVIEIMLCFFFFHRNSDVLQRASNWRLLQRCRMVCFILCTVILAVLCSYNFLCLYYNTYICVTSRVCCFLLSFLNRYVSVLKVRHRELKNFDGFILQWKSVSIILDTNWKMLLDDQMYVIYVVCWITAPDLAFVLS